MNLTAQSSKSGLKLTDVSLCCDKDSFYLRAHDILIVTDHMNK